MQKQQNNRQSSKTKINKNKKIQGVKQGKNLFNKAPLKGVKRASVKRTKMDWYKKILGTITKKGKKSLAKKALNQSLYITSRLYRIPSGVILEKMLKDFKCYVEIKKVVRRKNVNLIPFPVSKKRQRFLKIKWLLQGAKKSKEKIPFTHKLREEFAKIIEKPAYLKTGRTEMNRLIIENLSNAHFRWVQKKKTK